MGKRWPSEFQRAVEAGIGAFPDNRLVRLVGSGDVTMRHYHALLCTIFHQTYSGPYSFALAGVRCGWQHAAAKEYLIRHAEEELIHWRWVLDDLAATGYSGPGPRDAVPHRTAEAYVAFNWYVADHVPVARLATAAVLEGIGSVHGGTYGGRLVKAMGLKASQASFFLSHAETDKQHIVELEEVISSLELTDHEWQWMIQAAGTAGRLYRDMYDHEGYD